MTPLSIRLGYSGGTDMRHGDTTGICYFICMVLPVAGMAFAILLNTRIGKLIPISGIVGLFAITFLVLYLYLFAMADW